MHFCENFILILDFENWKNFGEWISSNSSDFRKWTFKWNITFSKRKKTFWRLRYIENAGKFLPEKIEISIKISSSFNFFCQWHLYLLVNSPPVLSEKKFLSWIFAMICISSKYAWEKYSLICSWINKNTSSQPKIKPQFQANPRSSKTFNNSPEWCQKPYIRKQRQYFSGLLLTRKSLMDISSKGKITLFYEIGRHEFRLKSLDMKACRVKRIYAVSWKFSGK